MNIDDTFARLETARGGLTSAEALRRIQRFGPNTLPHRGASAFGIFILQLKNPLIGLLLAAAAVSFGVGERLDAGIVAGILALSVGLGFFDEYRADRSARLLEARLTRTALVLRDGAQRRIPTEELVPGDVLLIEVGDIRQARPAAGMSASSAMV